MMNNKYITFMPLSLLNITNNNVILNFSGCFYRVSDYRLYSTSADNNSLDKSGLFAPIPCKLIFEGGGGVS